MTRHPSRTALLAALFVGTAGIAAAQATPEPQDPHHPGGAPDAPATPPSAAGPPMAMPPGPAAGDAAGPRMPADMAGMMEMMTPEMMQMMMDMMAGQCPMMGGPDAMAEHHGPDGPMRHRRGDRAVESGSPMLRGMAGRDPDGRGGDGHAGPSAIFDVPRLLAPDDVRARLTERLKAYGNPRLRLGTIAVAGEDSITAEIETVDGSLVERLVVDRFTGDFARTIE